MLELLSVFLDACTYLPLPGAAIGSIYYKRLSPELRVITFLCWSALLVNTVSTFLANQHINNLFLIHLDTIVETLILLKFYSLVLKEVVPKRFFEVGGVAFTLIALGIAYTVQPFDRFNSYARTIEALGIIMLALLFFHRILMEMKILNLEKDPLFWVNTGLLLYFSGGSLLFSLSNMMLRLDAVKTIYLWGVHGMFYLVLYLLISVAFWKEIQRLMA